MKVLNLDSVLEESPLFSRLTNAERSLVRERSQIVEFRKDEIIYREGEPASAFYLVILGRVLTYTSDRTGNKTFLEYLHRGKYFGIISLLTGEPHSVTAVALNDCLLLTIKKDDFEFLLKRIPVLSIDVSQTLSRRVKNKNIHQKTIFESTIISVFSSYSRAGKSIYALNTALSLRKETGKSLIILDVCPKDRVHSLPRRMCISGELKAFDLSGDAEDSARVLKGYISKDEPDGIDLICFSYDPDDESASRRFVSMMGLLVNDYHYVILDLPSVMDHFVFTVLSQSDQIHLLTSAEPVYLKRTRNLIARLEKDFDFQDSRIRVLINEYRASKLTHDQQAALLGRNIFATLPRIDFSASDKLVVDSPESEYARVIRRISRESGDCLVGLALGVGAGYGFCHIGVLKVFEEENIPVDIICGSSMGALIAAFWAIGKSSGEILESIREFKDPRYIWNLVDLEFPLLGFIKGNKLYNFLKKHFGNRTFHDVRLPLKIVASDIRRKETRVLDQGLLIDAIMASCTMPGVFKPFWSGEDILVDGGIMNPLPTEPLFAMGVKKIIAVNVTPSREDMLAQYGKMRQDIAVTCKPGPAGWFNWRRCLQAKLKNNILDIIFSSVEAMQSEMIIRESELADIVLHPDTSGMHWLEMHHAREFAKRGEEEARKNLSRIWQVIRE